MRIHPRISLAALAAVAATVAPTGAAAQIDIEPPRPNVMLLIDTSGSMEYMPDGSAPTVCNPASASDLNRWGTLVTVLTGTVDDRGCMAENRNDASFRSEFGLGGFDPYDAGYKLKHHRIVSGGWVATPGTAPSAIYDWPACAIGYRPWNSNALTCDVAATGWSQQSDGLLDVFADRVRFGLMTFDPDTSGGTGLGGGNPSDGMWSYFLHWASGGTAAAGNPDNCASKAFEVGVRNPAAPPWEGRLIGFGPTSTPPAPYTSLLDYQRAVNERIQQALIAVRPYGATPLAGMMQDAYTFFRDDDWVDPTTGEYFAPAQDPYYAGGCRDSYIIVLSDGEPNLDLRPSCDAGSGHCPYLQPYDIAHDLATSGGAGQQIKTFAVGFGLSADASATTPYDCNALTMPDDFNPGGTCDGATGGLKACCTMARIAYEGGTNKAYFADDLASLRSALSDVLSQVSAGSTSRTLPSFSSGTAVGSSSAPAKAYEFVSSFEPVTEDNLWTGNLERKRWTCETTTNGLEAILQDVDSTKGDDFAANVNEGKAARPREFLTVVGTTTGGKIHSARSIRPDLGADDGVGTYSGVTHSGSNSDIANVMSGAPEAMSLESIPPVCTSPLVGVTTAAQCASKIMNWELGGINGGGLPTRSGREFGAIYHATPFVHGNATDYLRDESYSVYAESTSTRPLMLYTATTDGQLHAFQVATNDPAETDPLGDELENNELWSFLPPAVLPRIVSQYPRTQQLLLDGAPVIRDVVFDRTAGNAQSGTADWHTVLLAGGGSALVADGGASGGFYYALDITDPTAPTFLWQLSTNATGEPLFGTHAPTPAIATIGYKDGTEIKEVAVAILPGGTGELVTGAAHCTGLGGDAQARQVTNFAHINKLTMSYRPRTQVRCWADGAARSLTIVRLEDGKILKSFRGKVGDGPALNPTSLMAAVAFDSPITGVPVPYPSRPGQVSDRVYVGDADGTLWRINLADPDSDNWTANIVFDAYPLATDSYQSGQPVGIPPVVAVDGLGNTAVLFATGDQEDFTSTNVGMKTRLWSIKEVPEKTVAVPFSVESNWLLNFSDGKRVTGPIALFDTVAYFSTFTPTASANACIDGYGSIWGVDYLKFTATAGGPHPLPRLAQDPNANPIVYVEEKPEAAGVVVFGVTVSAQPSCYETDVVADTYLGQHTAITTSTAPVYQLVYQTGSGGTADAGSKTKTKTQALPPLREMTRIDSWASIVE